MKTENMINITNIDMVKFVKTVYDLSKPVGAGFMHYKTNPLTEAEAISIINDNEGWIPNNVAIRMDYVFGRQCKMTAWKDAANEIWIDNKWYDHSDSQFEQLRKICNF